MDIVNLSREATKLRRFFEVFQNAEEVLREQAVADEKVRLLKAEQAKILAEIEEAQKREAEVLAQTNDRQRVILEKAEEERAAILAKAEKEKETVLRKVREEKAQLLDEMEVLGQKLTETQEFVANEEMRLDTELHSTRSTHEAVLQNFKSREDLAKQAMQVAEEKMRIAQEALAKLKAGL